MSRLQSILSICAILVVLIVGYYFLVSLPKHNTEMEEIQKEKIELEKERQRKKIELEEDIQREKIELEKERQQDKLDRERLETENEKREIYRQECIHIEQENVDETTEFLNECTKVNSNAFCFSSEAFKFLSERTWSEYIQDCIDKKIKDYWL